MNTGGDQPPSRRQLISPLPYSPPKTKAAFFIDGTTITHCAFSQSSCGTSLSGAEWISLSTAAASSIRLTSLVDRSAASVVDAIAKANHSDRDSHASSSVE